MKHAHECFASRLSVKHYEQAKEALLEAEREAAEKAEVRRMVESIFEKADHAGTGHIGMEALLFMHNEIGAGTEMDEETYRQMSEAIGANADHGWDAEHLFRAYTEDHPLFSLKRDHDLLFPPSDDSANPEPEVSTENPEENI